MPDEPNLQCFVQRAREGDANPGANFCEAGAYMFAELALRHASSFDAETWGGLLTFLELARDQPDAARDVLEGKEIP